MDFSLHPTNVFADFITTQYGNLVSKAVGKLGFSAVLIHNKS
jgi:hypothetical protein